LITKDEDFLALSEREESGPQVVWIRLGNISNNALWRAIEPQLNEIVQALNAGERIVEVL
jgi:predicted nuclease of predicted toxin-antitoxin system